MQYGVLGPIEACDAGRRLALGGPKQRALLAVLLLARNQPVSRDTLIDALWGEHPPATAPHSLDAYVSRLRRILGTTSITREPGGYVLAVAGGELDLDMFEQFATEGRERLAAGDATAAADRLRAALELWRGPALADVLYEPFGSQAAAALEEQRLEVTEERIDADLERGLAGELVGEVERLVREHPFRERLLGQLMLALYRSGQHARALEEGRRGRHRLAAELGLEPGRAVQQLERSILAHDPTLEHRPRASSVPSSGRRNAIPVIALLLAVSGALGYWELSRPDQHNRSSSAAVQLPTAASALARGFGSIWAADPGGVVERIDESTGAVADRIPVDGTPGAVAVSGGSVWVASVPGGSISRIDPATGTVTQSVGLGGARLTALVSGRGGLWVADQTDRSLLELDPASGAVRHTFTLSVDPASLAVTPTAIWVADYQGGTVSEIDPRGGDLLATVSVGNGPAALAVVGASVWVANALDSTVSRVDVRTARLTGTVLVKSGPVSVVGDGRWVWVASQYPGSVSKIDPRSGAIASTTTLDGSPTAAVAAAGRVWVGARSLTPHRGGTVTVLHSRPITIDPALQGDLLPPAADGLTRDELVTYAHVQGPLGTRLVPDLAVNVPLSTDGGTVYTFRLRPGIRYSDGRLVRAADFRRAIERSFRLGASAAQAFVGIVGATTCTQLNCDLSAGIVTDESARTVTVRLRAPDPDLLVNLTAAVASPVPAGTPWRRTVTKPIPGTGPYAIAAVGARRIVWVRNRFFHEWSHAAQPDGNPDRIVLRFGLQPAQEVREIEAGRADVITDNIPPRLLHSVRTRYASRLHSYVVPTTDFFQFNTALPPFNDVRVRRALNFAVDRATIVRLYGGATLATATCQVIAPGVTGYSRYCPYTRGAVDGRWRGPDLVKARRLVGASGTRGQRVTVWGSTDDPTIRPAVVRYVANVLRSVGYRVDVRLLSHEAFRRLPGHVLDTIQLSAAAWGDTAAGYVATWFTCNGLNGRGWFCDSQVDRMNAQARLIQATNPHAAASLWARIDRRLVDRAAWLPMINERGIDFLSARVANYESHPYWGLLVDQLWVR